MKIGDLVKQTYFSGLDRCSQDVVDTCVSEKVIKQMKTDFRSLEYLYRKSNAGSCTGNSVSENGYFICLNKSITLFYHYYIDPQIGKDLCDKRVMLPKG